MIAFLVLLASSRFAMHVTDAQDKALQGDDDSVVLVPSTAECDVGTKITVAYQRVANQRDPDEAKDFIGLYRLKDPSTVVAYDVAMITTASQTGEVELTCTRPGDMEVRMVRRNSIIGRVEVKVYGRCIQTDCSNHGTCVHGSCECNDGWEGEACELLSGQGASLAWIGNDIGEFYPGDEIRAKMFHSATDPQSSGYDTVSIVDGKGTIISR
jgi:hypothetical protein